VGVWPHPDTGKIPINTINIFFIINPLILFEFLTP